MKKLLLVLFFTAMGMFKGYSQALVQTYTDRCTGQVSVFTVPLEGQTVVAFYNRSRIFTSQDFQNGTLQIWLEETYLWWTSLSPCSTSQTGATATQQTTQQVTQQATQAATNAAATTPQVNVSPPPTPSPPPPTQTSQPTTTAPDTSSTNTAAQNTTTSGGNTTSQGNNTSTSGGSSSSQGSSQSNSNSNNSSSGSENTSTDQNTESTSTDSQNSESGTSGNEGGTEESTEVETTTEETSTEETSTEETTTEESTTEESTTEESTEETSTEESTEESSSEESSENEENSNEETDESTDEETTEEETTEEEQSEESDESESEEESDESSEEESEEETDEEESESDEDEESEDEDSEEESNDETEEEDGKKKKKKRNLAPPIVTANMLSQQGPDGRYTQAATFGISQSSLLGTETYGLNAMVYSNLQQFMLTANFSKVHINKEGRINRVYSASLGGMKMFTTYMGMMNHSIVWLGKKGSVKGLAFGTTLTSVDVDVRQGLIYYDNVLLGNSLTGFYTKSFNFNRLTISPMLAISSPFMQFDMYQHTTVWNPDVMIIGGANFTYKITQRFGLNVGVNIIEATIPEFPTLKTFTIGSRLSF